MKVNMIKMGCSYEYFVYGILFLGSVGYTEFVINYLVQNKTYEECKENLLYIILGYDGYQKYKASKHESKKIKKYTKILKESFGNKQADNIIEILEIDINNDVDKCDIMLPYTTYYCKDNYLNEGIIYGDCITGVTTSECEVIEAKEFIDNITTLIDEMKTIHGDLDYKFYNFCIKDD